MKVDYKMQFSKQDKIWKVWKHTSNGFGFNFGCVFSGSREECKKYLEKRKKNGNN